MTAWVKGRGPFQCTGCFVLILLLLDISFLLSSFAFLLIFHSCGNKVLRNDIPWIGKHAHLRAMRAYARIVIGRTTALARSKRTPLFACSEWNEGMKILTGVQNGDQILRSRFIRWNWYEFPINLPFRIKRWVELSPW